MRAKARYQPGDKIGGQYLVYQALMGGMGEVYLCLDLKSNLPLALKTFQSRYLANPRVRELFKAEVETWVALEKHPNIVRCFEMEIHGNQPFMVLEWISGEEGRGTDLRSWLWHGPLDLRLALDFAIDICRGLIHADQKHPGIIHRDLKPDNILVAEAPLAKVTDFGLATIVQQGGLQLADDMTGGRHTLLSADGAVGTPPYMAPEQWRAEEVDARADIYAIGCILYEMLTGAQPYTATTLNDFRRQHQAAPVPSLPDGLPRALDQLLKTCMAKRREDRFATMQELAQAVSLIYQQQFGDPPRAIALNDAFVADDYNNRGTTYMRLERYDAALADYSRAIELDSCSAPVYSNRGASYTKLKRYDEALADFSRAIEMDPSNPKTYNNRGSMYDGLQRYDEAVADFTKAIELEDRYAIAYFNRGSTYDDLQRYDAALADYSRAIELDPTLARAYFLRGKIYNALPRYDAALADYSRAIELEPTFSEVYVARGCLYDDLQYYNEALSDYARAIELDSTDALAYYNRGNTYEDLQHYDEALADYARAIELDPSFPKTYIARGVIYRTLNRSEEALADYTRAIELDPAVAQVYFNRGNMYDELQRYDEALADYTRAIELDPNFAGAYNNRGQIYKVSQRYDEALANFTRAIDLNPEDAIAYNNRGSVYALLNYNDQALADYARALELDPTNAQLYARLGAVLIVMGALPQALAYFETAARLGLPQAAQYVAQIQRALGMVPEEEINPTQRAFEAFQSADTALDMQRVVAEFPSMTESGFIAAVEQAITQQVPPQFKPAFEQRLAWLRQIAAEQQ